MKSEFLPFHVNKRLNVVNKSDAEDCEEGPLLDNPDNICNASGG